MQSEELIRCLAADTAKVRPLSHPAWRAITWFILSLAYASFVVYAKGVRSDLSLRAVDPHFLVEIFAVLATAMTAAAAAFCAGCPGRPLWERAAPLPFVAMWMGALADGCWRDWLRHGPQGLAVQPDFACFPDMITASLAPVILICVMIRQGAPIAPRTTTGLAILAATSIAAAALLLSHEQHANITVLVWQFGLVLSLSGLAALVGRRVLYWRTANPCHLDHN